MSHDEKCMSRPLEEEAKDYREPTEAEIEELKQKFLAVEMPNDALIGSSPDTVRDGPPLDVMKLEGRDLDFAILNLGRKKPHDIRWSEEGAGKEWATYIPSGKPWRTHQIDAVLVPFYHKSLDAIRPVVEKCVEEKGFERYYAALCEACRLGAGLKEDWHVALATATDQARAVLLAYAERNKS